MASSPDPTQNAFNTTLELFDGSTTQLPVSASSPLFVVGPNGAGKSGLIFHLYRMNHTNAVRISAHRQTWMETNFVPFSPQDKVTTENNARGQDTQPRARTYEWSSNQRAGLVIADLIDADNALSRKVRAAVVSDKPDDAKIIASELPPLDVISELFAGSGIPIKLSITPSSAIEAIKREGSPYSIASLSDGERAALLIAGSVLTAKPGSMILVDEPERHLHASIVTPLLLQLFAKRSDCTFVVSTHELSLPIICTGAKTVLIRDAAVINDEFTQWDIDVLEPGTEIDDATREAIIGSRRKVLFIEGTQASLDQPLYEILFPGVTIIPRSSCRDVEHAVSSIRDSRSVAWVSAYGIVDQDQLTTEKKQELQAQNVYALSVYSVEGLYYHPIVVDGLSKRQESILGTNARSMVDKAWDDVLASICPHVDRLAARMTEQTVKDQISIEMPDWKSIKAGHDVAISVDAQSLYQAEKAQLQAWVTGKDIAKIMARYPVRETTALVAVANALQFKSKGQYEAAVRKLVIDDAAIRATLMGNFGGLPTAIC